MRADKFYEAVLAVLGEERYSCEDYTHLRFRIINQALASCLSTYNTQLLSRGEKALESFAPVVSDGDKIPVDDNMALEVLVYITAALLCADSDPNKANILNEFAERGKAKYSKINFKEINNSY